MVYIDADDRPGANPCIRRRFASGPDIVSLRASRWPRGLVLESRSNSTLESDPTTADGWFLLVHTRVLASGLLRGQLGWRIPCRVHWVNSITSRSHGITAKRSPRHSPSTAAARLRRLRPPPLHHPLPHHQSRHRRLPAVDTLNFATTFTPGGNPFYAPYPGVETARDNHGFEPARTPN